MIKNKILLIPTITIIMLLITSGLFISTAYGFMINTKINENNYLCNKYCLIILCFIIIMCIIFNIFMFLQRNNKPLHLIV